MKIKTWSVYCVFVEWHAERCSWSIPRSVNICTWGSSRVSRKVYTNPSRAYTWLLPNVVWQNIGKIYNTVFRYDFISSPCRRQCELLSSRRLSSVVRPSSVRRPSDVSFFLNFSKIFFSETTERILLKFLRNVPQCVGSKVCVFLIDILHNIAAVTKNRTMGKNHVFW